MKYDSKRTLYHPILGVRQFNNEQEADTVMAMPTYKRGGWEWYTGQDLDQIESQENTSPNAAISSGNQGDHQKRGRGRKVND